VEALTLDQIGGRRFLVTLVSGAGTFMLCWAGRIDANAYMLTTIGIVGAYITGNVSQRKIEATQKDAP
jgi:hypothetical protein